MPFLKGHKSFRTKESYKKASLKKEKHPMWKGGKPKCIDCGKELSTYNVKRCPKCYHETQRKPFPKFICLQCGKEFDDKNFNKERKFCSNKCYGESLKGIPTWNSGKKQLATTGIKNNMWKGDDVGYVALHKWVSRNKGKATKCSKCSSTKSIDWANKDHKYKRSLEDYIELCRSCHRKYDIKHNKYKQKHALH